jgi:4'-phosphopantetheinyl transferase
MAADTTTDRWRGRALDVELRWFRLPKEISPADLDVLSAEERTRSADFKAARRRLEYVASRARLRRSLGEALRVAPSSIAISPDDFGKPQHSGGVEFNLSHSAGAVLIGWGDRPVGVDLEAATRATQHIGRLRIVADVRDAMSIELIAAFTLVEATTKALGRGLAAVRGLRIDSVAASGEIRFTSPGIERPIRAIAVAVPEGYVAAVAVLD